MTKVLLKSDLTNPDWWRFHSKNLFFFETVVLAKAWPDKFHDFGQLQHDMCDFLEPARNSAKKKLISVYRESLKTTVLHGFVIWTFAWSFYKKEPLVINYNTATETNATSFMEDVRHSLDHCPLLHAMFGLPARKEDYDSFTKRMVKHGHVRFYCSSFEEQQASRHANVIINDDIVNELNHRTEASREDIKRKWRFQKSVSSQIKDTTLSMEVDSGTPYHGDDLMWHLMNRNRTYDKFIRGALVGWPKPSVSDVLSKRVALTNPELMTYEKLLEKLDEQGQGIFSSQYLLRPLAEIDALCLERWLRYWTKLPETSWRTMVVDPGGEEPGSNDPTGVTICDTDTLGNLYVLHADEVWLHPKELIDYLKDLIDRYRPDDKRVEKEKYRITVGDSYEDKLRQYQFSFVEHKHRNKEARIWRLRQWFEHGKIFVNENQRALIDQALQYPQSPGNRDDILDSLSYHLDIYHVPKESQKPRFEPKIETNFSKELDDYMLGMKNRRLEVDYDASF